MKHLWSLIYCTFWPCWSKKNLPKVRNWSSLCMLCVPDEVISTCTGSQLRNVHYLSMLPWQDYLRSDISSTHIKLHKNVNGETVREGSIRKWCVSLPLFISNCNMYQGSSLINIDLNGITHPLLLIHLKADIDFLLLCQWEHTPLSVSFYLPQCHWIS